MNSIKYIGMDVHSASISIAVLNDTGKLIMEATIETEAAVVVDFVRGLQGTLQVTFEEGIHAAWLYELLRPHVGQQPSPLAGEGARGTRAGEGARRQRRKRSHRLA